VTFQGAREFQDLWLSHLEMCNQAGSANEESCKGTNPSNGVWVKGFGYFGSQDAKPAYNYAGYDDTIFGTMVAYDMPIIDENTRAGIGLGYSHTTIDGKTYETNSNVDFDTFQPTVYIGHEQGPWFIHGSSSFGYNQYSQQRDIVISGTDYASAKSDYSGEDYTSFLNTGWNFSAPLKSTVTPIASLQYSRVNMDSYTEKGAGNLDLHAKPQGYDFLESGLGAKVERDFSIRNWHLVPEIHAEWLHDFLNPTMGQSTEFTVGSAPLYTTGIKTDPDTLHAGTSLSLLSCTCSKTKLSLEAGYDFYWRNDGYSANQVTMRLTARF
jgi:outer membrane autotransporter protein